MSYAIYSLRVGQDTHNDFASFKKHKHQVMGDVITFLIDYFRGLSREPVTDPAVLQGDLHLLTEFVYKQLPDCELRVLSIMDQDTEERIDEMLEFQENCKKYAKDFNLGQNREAEVLISRLDYGSRRLLSYRFSHYWLEGEPGELEQNQAEFIWYSNQIRAFNGLLQSDIDMVRYEQFLAVLQGTRPGDVLTSEETIDPTAQYIWWTTQGDCEGTMEYHNRARFEGKLAWGGEIRESVIRELRSRHGRHANGTVWGLRTQPTFTNDTFHRYIQRYCGGVAVNYDDLKVIRHNLGFVTDLNLNLISEF